MTAVEILEQEPPKTSIDHFQDVRKTLHALEMMRSVLATDLPTLLDGYQYAYTHKVVKESLHARHLQRLGEIPIFLDEMLMDMHRSVEEALGKLTGQA